MKRVLILDDYSDINEVLSLLLIDADLKVESLTTSKLLTCYLNSFKPDLLILDVLLDNADGRDLCNCIKDNPKYKHIKVIMISTLPIGWKDVHCKADAKIDKPFDIYEFRDLTLKLLQND